MTHNYEVVYIFDSALEEAQISELLETFHGLLKTDATPEPVTDVNHWGKRTLAYPIAGHEVGHYVIAHFDAAGESLPEYERALKLNPSVMRYLVVINEGARPVPFPSASDSDDDGGRPRRNDDNGRPKRTPEVAS